MQLKKSIIERAKQRPLRIASYLRVSTKEQAIEGDSIPAQRNFMERTIEHWRNTGIPIGTVTFYEEQGRSGKNMKRPEVRRMRQDIERGLVDVLLAIKIDRLSRNTDDFRVIERLLDEHNVEFCPINDFYDPSNAQGWLMQHMTIGQAEYERRVTGERTRMALEYRARQGFWNGGYIFGYRKDKQTERLVIHPEEAETVRRDIFDAFERLGSVGRVLEHLHERGILYPKKRSSQGEPDEYVPFQKQRIRRIIENEVYRGHIVWGVANVKRPGTKSTTCIRTENVHEPIITAEQFARIQRQLNQNRKKRTNTRYSRGRQSPLRNLVRCGCGSRMTPKGGTGRNGTYHYYGCTKQNHNGKSGCTNPQIPAEALESAVIGRLRRIATTPEARERIVQEALRNLGDDTARVERELGLIRQRMTVVQTEINNLTKAIARLGEAAAELVEEELTQRKTERDRLREQIKELELENAPHDAIEAQARQFVEQWSDIGQLFDDATLEEQRVILQHLIEIVELQVTDRVEKAGTYMLRLFPEIGPLLPDDGNEPVKGHQISRPQETKKTGLPKGETGRVLTDSALVRQFGQKAPRLGLEPRT